MLRALNGKTVRLTKAEYTCLAARAARQGQVVTSSPTTVEDVLAWILAGLSEEQLQALVEELPAGPGEAGCDERE